MEYYLGIFRFKVTFDFDNGTAHSIDSEMMQLVKASNKELAREALMEYWEAESNGAVLYELRVNDTVIGK